MEYNWSVSCSHSFVKAIMARFKRGIQDLLDTAVRDSIGQYELRF